MMLRNCCQSLVEDELQGLVVGADDERTNPKIRAPVANCLGQPNQFPFISCKATMAWRERAAEEGDRPAVLMEHRANARSRGIALNDKAPGEVGKSQHRRRREPVLQSFEGRLCYW